MALTSCGLINAIRDEDDARMINLLPENITCIERELNRTNTMDPSCAIIQEDVAMLYEIRDAYDVVRGLESLVSRDGGSDIFAAFCQPSCMQTFFDAWKTCESFDELSNVADLLTGLCSTNNERPCYSDLEQLPRVVDDSIECFHALQPEFGNCNTNCRITISLDVKTYGCCLNVFPNYVATFDPGNSEEFGYVLDECRVRRPAVCPIATPSLPDTGAGLTTTAYPSATPCSSTSANNAQVNDNNDQGAESRDTQANQQGVRNGSGQPFAVAAVLLLLNSIIVILIQQL